MKQNNGYLGEKKIKKYLENKLDFKVRHYKEGIDLEVTEPKPTWIEVKSTKAITKNRENYYYFGKYRLREEQHQQLRHYKDGVYCFVTYLSKQHLRNNYFTFIFVKPNEIDPSFCDSKTFQPTWINVFQKYRDKYRFGKGLKPKTKTSKKGCSA